MSEKREHAAAGATFRDDLAALRGRISALAAGVTAGFRTAMEGFDWSDAPRIDRARAGVPSIARESEEITGGLVELASRCPLGDRALVESPLGVITRLAQIGSCIEGFCDAAAVKMREGLLFSDKALKEMEDLHAETGSLLDRAVLAFTAQDAGLSRKVAEQGRAVERMIDRIGDEHEKRLASGSCAVRSSALFLELLDALRRIAGHAVGMACASARGECGG